MRKEKEHSKHYLNTVHKFEEKGTRHIRTNTVGLLTSKDIQKAAGNMERK